MVIGFLTFDAGGLSLCLTLNLYIFVRHLSWSSIANDWKSFSGFFILSTCALYTSYRVHILRFYDTAAHLSVCSQFEGGTQHPPHRDALLLVDKYIAAHLGNKHSKRGPLVLYKCSWGFVCFFFPAVMLLARAEKETVPEEPHQIAQFYSKD